MNIIVCPGSSEAVQEAKDLFGDSRVVAGAWRAPIHINDLTEDEATFATEYFQNQGKKVSVEA